MTPQENELIMSVARRLDNPTVRDKDLEADRLIQEQIGSKKDALYLLTQAVIVQEQGLKHAETRIQQLEADLQRLQQEASAPKHTSFLGGLFGGASDPPPRPAPAQLPVAAPAEQYAPSSGGGAGSFLKTAAATAVGVAGGQLIFDGLRHLLGGSSGTGYGVGGFGANPQGGFLGGGPSVVNENTTNVYENTRERTATGDRWDSASDGASGDFDDSQGVSADQDSQQDDGESQDIDADDGAGSDFDDTQDDDVNSDN